MIEQTGNDLVVIASNPQEMAESQIATIGRVAEKEKAAAIEVRQCRVTVDAATRSGIDTRIPRRLLKKSEQRHAFIVKVREAMEAGYVLVPNFPGETIAIRVKRKSPLPKIGSSDWSPGRADDVATNDHRAEVLPSGVGRYVNPQPLVNRTKTVMPNPKKPGEMMTTYFSQAVAFADEIGMPAEFIRPTVVERTGMCMARKIFDEVAVAGNNWTTTGRGSSKGDPIVIGRIFDPSRAGRMLSFLVAWFVDTSTI